MDLDIPQCIALRNCFVFIFMIFPHINDPVLLWQSNKKGVNSIFDKICLLSGSWGPSLSYYCKVFILIVSDSGRIHMGVLGCQMLVSKTAKLYWTRVQFRHGLVENLDVDLFHALMFHSPYLIMWLWVN